MSEREIVPESVNQVPEPSLILIITSKGRGFAYRALNIIRSRGKEKAEEEVIKWKRADLNNLAAIECYTQFVLPHPAESGKVFPHKEDRPYEEYRILPTRNEAIVVLSFLDRSKEAFEENGYIAVPKEALDSLDRVRKPAKRERKDLLLGGLNQARKLLEMDPEELTFITKLIPEDNPIRMLLSYLDLIKSQETEEKIETPEIFQQLISEIEKERKPTPAETTAPPEEKVVEEKVILSSDQIKALTKTTRKTLRDIKEFGFSTGGIKREVEKIWKGIAEDLKDEDPLTPQEIIGRFLLNQYSELYGKEVVEKFIAEELPKIVEKLGKKKG